MSDVIKVIVSVRTNKVGSESRDEVKFDRKVWDAMSEDEREDACREAMFNLIEWNYKVKEEGY